MKEKGDIQSVYMISSELGLKSWKPNNDGHQWSFFDDRGNAMKI